MPVGVEIINDSGRIIIDQNYLSLGFRAKGSITLNQEYSYSGSPGPTYTDVWRANPYAAATGGLLVAFRARYATRPVGVWAGGYGDTEFVGYSPDSTPPIVDWWSFGTVPATGAGNVGLEVFDAAGTPTYVSNSKPMKVVTALNDVVVGGQSITGPAGDYALCVGIPLGGVRTGSETSIGAGAYAWLEARPLWYPPTSTGFTGPEIFLPVDRKEHFSYPTGWRSGDIRASMLLVDVAGL